MSSIVDIDILEERVVAAAELIVSLRSQVRSLEQEIMSTRAKALSLSSQSLTPSPDHSLGEELKRLRAERVVVRENIRGLLREIDRVSW